MKMQWKSLALSLVLAIFTLSGASSAQTLDQSFGEFGAVEWNVSQWDRLYDVQLGQGGAIYSLGRSTLNGSVGGIMVAKHSANGELDESFGGFGDAPPGVIFTTIQNTTNHVVGLKVLPNGKFYTVSGTSGYGWTVVRYLPDGWLDHSFGSSGVVFLSAIGQGIPRGFEVVNGKLVIWGGNRVIRLTEEGAPDTFFGGGDGLVYFEDQIGSSFLAYDAAFAGNRMIFAGHEPLEEEFMLGDPCIFALNSNGGRDNSFGTNGRIDLGHISGTLRHVEANDGMLTCNIGQFVIRLDSSGNFDPDFGTGGMVGIDLIQGDRIRDLILQSHGRTVVAISTHDGPDQNQFMVTRLLDDGQLDFDFGNESGWYRQTFGQNATARDLIAYSNGKVLIAGDYKLPFGDAPKNFLMVRTDRDDPGGTFDVPGKFRTPSLNGTGNIQGRFRD